MSGPGPGLSASVGHRVLKGGTSIIWHQLSCLSLVQPVTRSRVVGVEGGGGGGWCLTRCWVLRDRALCLVFLGRPRVSVGWLWAVITVEPPGLVLGRRRCW